MKISTQLYAGFATMIALFMAAAIAAAWHIKGIEQANHEMDRTVQLLQLAEDWKAHVRQNSARSLAVGIADGPAMLDFFKSDMAQTSALTSVTQQQFLELA
ncbi:MAG: hypothetical protein ACEQSK_17955, partial [Sphingomonadaceae bacterium]